jgi:hypothetical protein
MKEYELTTFLFHNLQHKGIKKLINLTSSQDIRFHREIGNSAFVTDICISIGDHNEKKFNNKKVKFIAIEIKISDWKNGLYQAWRYNNFAEKSFLAIYRPYFNRVDLDKCISNNIGLIVFDEESFDVIHRPKNNKFRQESYGAMVREKIWNTCSSFQNICPA